MPLPITDKVWKLTLRGDIFLQEVNNVYYFAGATGSGSAADLISTFIAEHVGTILTFTCEQMHYADVHVEGVQVVDDIADAIVDETGDITGECLPPFVAWSFRLNRPNTSTRNGYKRFAGVAESSQTNGVALSGVLTNLDTYALTLAQPLVGTEDTYLPVIRTAQRNNDVVDPPEYTVFITASYREISSQNTRKFGRGN